jgi:hypothetical protein
VTFIGSFHQGDGKMSDHTEEQGYGLSNIRNVFLGLLIGGLAGAATMILFAPQSGKKRATRLK